MYVFVHSQAQKYGKIFLVFRIFRAKMEQKKKGRIKKIIITPFYLPFIISLSNKISILDSLHNR